MMRDYQKYIALFFITVFSVFLFPKEIIHELHHHDTKDLYKNFSSSHTFDNQHHHCKSLLLIAPDLLSFLEEYIPAKKDSEIENSLQVFKEINSCFLSSFSRGPPACI